MKPRKSLIVAALLLTSGVIQAQWKIVGSINPTGAWNGAMNFCHGTLWAGYGSLAMSSDTGKTWKRVPLPASEILDIGFLNDDTGLVATSQGAYITTNRGVTWIASSVSVIGARRAIFDRSGRKAFLILESGAQLYSAPVSNWNWNVTTVPTTYGISLGTGIDGTLYAQGAGTLFSSSDDGASWKASGAQLDMDTYSFDVDSCDASKLFIAKEGYAIAGDGFSHVYHSSNHGQSWTTVFSQPVNYLSGAFAGSSHAHFAASLSDGIIRTTNDGASWTNIGGPTSIDFDGHNLCTVNDNIVFCIDASGSIWATFNGGGDSLQVGRGNEALSLTPSSLFDGDTIFCADSVVRSASITRSGCPLPNISRWTIAGADSSSYRVASIDSKSVNLVFRPQHSGSLNARLVLFCDDGLTDTISLGGVRIDLGSVFQVTPASIFDGDTLDCNSTQVQSITISRSGCAPKVSDLRIDGIDASSYKVLFSRNDSVSVSFTSQHGGSQPAYLLLTLSDGTVDTVALLGSGTYAHTLSLASVDQKTDTIGGDIAVPITIAGLVAPENVELVMHYSGDVIYRGSFATNGSIVDEPSEMWVGRSKLLMQNVTSGSAAGWAEFNVFSDSIVKPHVTFDSVRVLTSDPCTYLMPQSPAEVVITPPSGCGVPLISQLALGKPVEFSIRPNPTAGNIELVSQENLGAVTITIYDALGWKRSSISATISAGVPLPLQLPDANGMYNVRVDAQEGSHQSRVVVVK